MDVLFQKYSNDINQNNSEKGSIRNYYKNKNNNEKNGYQTNITDFFKIV